MFAINYADHMLPLGRGYQFTFFSVKYKDFNTEIQTNSIQKYKHNHADHTLLLERGYNSLFSGVKIQIP